MKIAIVIATYRKLDGSTYSHLERALLSIKNQSHQDYKVFMIGDDYDDNDEFVAISKTIDPDKIYIENLPIAVERIKYEGHNLWVCGGVHASNIGIERALADGYNYICILDHDDYYFENHLQLISETIEATGTHFVSTKCREFPNIAIIGTYTPFRPTPQLIYKVSACIDFSHYNIRFRNLIEEDNWAHPSDCDLWTKIDLLMIQNKEEGILVDVESCAHPTERSTIYSPLAVKRSITPTQESLNLVTSIAKKISTFHYHYHVLYDLANSLQGNITYVEIGCYSGGSSCLLLQRPLTKVIAIDLAYPVSKEHCISNINMFNPHNNEFYYIQGNSHAEETLNELLSLTNKIDILFIDGGHSYQDVIKDFEMYEHLIKRNGYIVFDDYNDSAYSPEVKLAVDFIVTSKGFHKYVIIGTFKNVLEAQPKEMKEGNCFIIQKKLH